MKLEQFGIHMEEGKYHEAMTFTVALLFNVIHQKTGDYLKKYDLNPSKLNILMAIRYHGKKEGLRQVELSKHLLLTPSNMTKMIDKLQKEGLVNRVNLDGDRRVNIIKISKKAEALLDSLWGGFNALLMDMAKDMNKAEQKQLANLMANWFMALVK